MDWKENNPAPVSGPAGGDRDPAAPKVGEGNPQICPYLGIYSDAQTRYSFPETLNCCHRVKRPQRIALDHQGDACLAGAQAYQACPVNASDGIGRLPKELRGIEHKAGPGTGLSLAMGGLALLVVLAIGYLIFIRPSGQADNTDPAAAPAAMLELTRSAAPAGWASPTPVPVAEFSPTPPVPTLTLTLPPQGTPTPLSAIINPQGTGMLRNPTSTIYNSPTPGPLVNTPFGPNGRYLVYKVNDGDMMENMAKLFRTSPNVLKVLNGLKPEAGFWPGMMAVVAVGEADPNSVFPMQAVWLDQPMRLDVLAQKYKTSQDELRSFNGLGPGDTVPAGRWIVARKASLTP